MTFGEYQELTNPDVNKIKHILDTAYETNAIAKNKWRIENREQLRQQRKIELKQLMEKPSNYCQRGMKRRWNKLLNWLIPTRREKLLAKIVRDAQKMGLYEETSNSLEWFAQQLYEKFEMRGDGRVFDDLLERAKAMHEEKVRITEMTSDGHHTFRELYEFRKAYNVALFNQFGAEGKHEVHKSWKHHDGNLCFGGGWFIVVAMLPHGQISNHYEAKDWDLFRIPEVEKAKFEFDGHTGKDVINRLIQL